jgi:hypothetical protein
LVTVGTFVRIAGGVGVRFTAVRVIVGVTDRRGVCVDAAVGVRFGECVLVAGAMVLVI